MAGLGYDIKWMAIIDVIEGGFAKELVGITKHERTKRDSLLQKNALVLGAYGDMDGDNIYRVISFQCGIE